jgi:hypothetical protein
LDRKRYVALAVALLILIAITRILLTYKVTRKDSTNLAMSLLPRRAQPPGQQPIRRRLSPGDSH